MSSSYPVVINFEDVGTTCILNLSDGSNITIDISSKVLNNYLVREGHPNLEWFRKRGTAQAIVGLRQMNEQLWSKIGEILRKNQQAQSAARRFPLLKRRFAKSFRQIATMPHHVYGGIAPPDFGCLCIYTIAPFNFRPDEQKGRGWYFCVLQAPGFNLVRTHVNVQSGRVEMSLERAPFHFLEDSTTTKE